MKLVKYNPSLKLHNARSFGNVFDKFFNEDFDGDINNSFVPSVDIAETETSFEISVAAPGLKKEDFSLSFEEGRLTISGERKFVNENNSKNFHSVETQFGSFNRTFHLPDSVKEDKIKASYENGILLIEVPKDEKKIVKRAIEIK